MVNPILQMLGNNQMLQKISAIKNMMNGRNPQDMYQAMMQSNPQFRNFVEQNRGKTIEDIAMEYDIDLDMLKRFM